MKYFDKGKEGRTIVIGLEPGDDVLGSINTVIKETGLKNGYIASGIGTLDYCVMHMVVTTGYPSEEVFPHWDDVPLELSSIDGIIADGKPHLHIVISDKDKAVAGHLELGCRILYLGEVVIKEIIGQEFVRVPDKNNISFIDEKK